MDIMGINLKNVIIRVLSILKIGENKNGWIEGILGVMKGMKRVKGMNMENGKDDDGKKENGMLGVIGGITGAIELGKFLIPQIVKVVEIVKGNGNGKEKKEIVLDFKPIIEVMAKQLGLKGKIPQEVLDDLIELAVNQMNKDKEKESKKEDKEEKEGDKEDIEENVDNEVTPDPDTIEQYWNELVNYAKVIGIMDAKLKHYESKG